MKIQTEAFILRPWKLGDANELAEIANSKKRFDNMRDLFPYPFTLHNAVSFILSAAGEFNSSIHSAIEINGKAAGYIGIFFKQDIYRKNIELEYFLAEEHCGKGIMTDVIRRVSDYIFTNYDVIRIYAEVFSKNTAARKSLEKAGFVQEAILRCKAVKNSVTEDICIYSLVRG